MLVFPMTFSYGFLFPEKGDENVTIPDLLALEFDLRAAGFRCGVVMDDSRKTLKITIACVDLADRSKINKLTGHLKEAIVIMAKENREYLNGLKDS